MYYRSSGESYVALQLWIKDVLAPIQLIESYIHITMYASGIYNKYIASHTAKCTRRRLKEIKKKARIESQS